MAKTRKNGAPRAPTPAPPETLPAMPADLSTAGYDLGIPDQYATPYAANTPALAPLPEISEQVATAAKPPPAKRAPRKPTNQARKKTTTPPAEATLEAAGRRPAPAANPRDAAATTQGHSAAPGPLTVLPAPAATPSEPHPSTPPAVHATNHPAAQVTSGPTAHPDSGAAPPLAHPRELAIARRTQDAPSIRAPPPFTVLGNGGPTIATPTVSTYAQAAAPHQSALGKRTRSPSTELTPRAHPHLRTPSIADASADAAPDDQGEDDGEYSTDGDDDGTSTAMFTSDIASANRFDPLVALPNSSFGDLIDEDYDGEYFGPVHAHTQTPPPPNTTAAHQVPTQGPPTRTSPASPTPTAARLSISQFFFAGAPSSNDAETAAQLSPAQIADRNAIFRSLAYAAGHANPDTPLEDAPPPPEPTPIDPLERSRGPFPEIHMDSPAEAWYGLAERQVRYWSSLTEVCVLVRTFDQHAHLPENLAASAVAIRKVIMRHVNVPNPIVLTPEASTTALHTTRYPKTFLVRGLSKEHAVVLLTMGVLSTRLITFQVLTRKPRLPRLLVLIAGFDVAATAEAILATVLRTLSQPAVLSFLRGLPDKTKHSPVPCTPDHFLPLLESITVEEIPKRARGNIPAHRYAVISTKSTLVDVDHWHLITQFLASLNYESHAFGTGRAIPTGHCSLCNGVEHPRGLCPFPLVPGWNGGGRAGIFPANKPHRRGRPLQDSRTQNAVASGSRGPRM
ncbi:hypothetical protein FA95DRAFT_1606372 [Auriscalpium vulgare]|uniref:Uncharacterized protein n=1 Tax=Auriscalpium vulgare TaxID=40419 RepID=A0ACB8RUA6_9AGAM|nr:hypothetical protein FA95DRAFT_1606372 [Auriscalpium vulgare]